jgi:hypothetical protein
VYKVMTHSFSTPTRPDMVTAMVTVSCTAALPFSERLLVLDFRDTASGSETGIGGDRNAMWSRRV